MLNILTWLKSLLSSRYKAMWLLRRGMVRAKLHKNHAAVADYSAVVDLEGVSADVRAMALYNRSLVYHATAHESKAIDDLNQILEMADIAENLKTEARRKLVRMERTSNRADTREPAFVARSPGGSQDRTEPKSAGKTTNSR